MVSFVLSGGILMAPLGICSLLGVAIILERSFFWIQHLTRAQPEKVELTYQNLKQRKISQALEVCNSSKDFSLICVKACLESHNALKALTLESLASQVLKPTRRFQKTMETIITIAPLLGILGTVLGIIASFQASSPGNLGDPAKMMAGLSQALVTTATGLGISIFMLVFHNFFLRLAEEAKEKIEEELTLFEELADS